MRGRSGDKVPFGDIPTTLCIIAWTGNRFIDNFTNENREKSRNQGRLNKCLRKDFSLVRLHIFLSRDLLSFPFHLLRLVWWLDLIVDVLDDQRCTLSATYDLKSHWEEIEKENIVILSLRRIKIIYNRVVFYVIFRLYFVSPSENWSRKKTRIFNTATW